jgi:hypothetical protein
MPLSHEHQYGLRIARRIPLRPDGRGATAFDLLSIEFLRDDGRLCGSADAYFPRELDPPPDFVEAAVMLGSGYLVEVCHRALTSMGFVRDVVGDAFGDALSQALIIDNFRVLEDGSSTPVLRTLFAKALMRNIPRCFDAVFVAADPAELPFWSATIGARLVDGLIIASASRKMPDELPPKQRQRKRKRGSGTARLSN